VLATWRDLLLAELPVRLRAELGKLVREIHTTLL